MSAQAPVTVRRGSFPGAFAAFHEIDLDNGAINRLEPAAVEYEVPGEYAALLGRVEPFLASLTQEQLRAYCCESPEEREVMTPGGMDGLADDADQFLNLYFNGWSA